MSVIIERVAKAIDDVVGGDLESLSIEMGFGDKAKAWRDEAITLAARAAIKAMREPTDAMTDHFGDWMGDQPKDHAIAQDLWREAIDEALI